MQVEPKEYLQSPETAMLIETPQVNPIGVVKPPETPLEVLEEEPEIEKRDWSELSYYKITTAVDDKNERKISDILEINRTLRYCEQELIKKKKPFSEVEELEDFSNFQLHFQLLKSGDFSWEKELSKLDSTHAVIKETISKLSHPFDHEMITTDLIQKMFPLDLIDSYLSLVNRVYGQPVYDKALRIQTNLMEIFLWHHFNSDTKFHLKISTGSLNLIDPFLRVKIREANKNDLKLKEKYFHEKFDLKKFAFKVLDLYFPNVTWRYVGAGHEMHRWSLQLVLTMFELGFWDYSELTEFINTLFQKLENLLALEKRSYEDFETSLKAYPVFCKNLKHYFFECKELVTAICMHVIVLMNDKSFMESHYYFNKKLSLDVVDPLKSWENAYFNNSDISNILHRCLTQYILRALSYANKNMFTQNTLLYTSDFIMLVTDIENDICLVSSKVMNQSMLEYYLNTPDVKDTQLALEFRQTFMNHLDRFATNTNRNNFQKIQTNFISDLNRLLIAIEDVGDQRDPNRDRKKKHRQYTFALHCLPKIIMSIQSILAEEETSKECDVKLQLAFIQLCRGSIISQVLITDETGMLHFNHMFDKKAFSAVLIVDSIFSEDYSLFYIHRQLTKKFLEYFKGVMKKVDSTFQEEPKKYKLVDTWYQELKKVTVTAPEDQNTCLEELVIYFVYCRWLVKLIENGDNNFESKFVDFSIQDLVSPAFFDFLLKIILNKDFLKVEGHEGYSFTPFLENADSRGLNLFVAKKTEGALTEVELKGALFEIAMMTMKLMNHSCSRLYTNWIYQEKAKPYFSTFLSDSEYMLDIGGGLSCRAEVIKMFSLFQIFPNNHLLSNRIVNFPGVPASAEARVVGSHSNGILADQIIKEINHIKKYATFGSKSDINQLKTYVYEGLFPMIYKYAQGMLVTYARDDKLDMVYESFDKIQKELAEIAPILCDNMNIDFRFETVKLGKQTKEHAKITSHDNNLMSIFGPTKVSPSEKANKRRPDPQEKLYPKLYMVRDIFLKIVERIEAAYLSDEDAKYSTLYSKLQFKARRPTALQFASNFDHLEETADDIEEEYRKSKKSLEANRNLMDAILTKTGLESSEMRFFRELMEVYQSNKKLALNKPPEENIFIKFLESGTSNPDNIISFLIMITNTYFKEATTAEDNSVEKGRETDVPLLMLLNNEVLFALLSFFDRMLNNCFAIKDGLYKQVKDDEDGKDFISFVYYMMTQFGLLVLNKTFMDFDWKLINDRFKVLSSFMKNLSENNYIEFKAFLSEFQPKLKILPEFNKASKSLFYDLYTRTEVCGTQHNLVNTNNELVLNDRAEVYGVLKQYLKIITECSSGPFQKNQDQIYKFRTDMWVGAVRRIVDNLDSNLYELKDCVLDYICSLIEENPVTTQHFGANITFDEMMKIIHVILKRLYIYAIHSKDKKKYAELVKKAQDLYLKKTVEKKAKLLQEELNEVNKFSFHTKEAISKGITKLDTNDDVKYFGEDDNELYFDYSIPSVITKEMEECIVVTDYNDLLETYLSSETFSDHILMRMAIKINSILLAYSEHVAGYKICMDNIYISLIDKYDEDVPVHIRKKIGVYQPKESIEFPERHVFYMFLTKITSEIELRNIDTKKNQQILFPLKPCTFFITDQTKINFENEVEHAEMLTSLQNNFQKFQIEMIGNLEFYRKYPIFYKLSQDDTFYKIKWGLWVLGLALNVLLIIFYNRNEDSSNNHIDTAGWLPILILSIVIAAISFGSMVMWFMSRYSQKVDIAVIEHKPEQPIIKPLEKLTHKFKTHFYYSILMENYPVFFFIHAMSCILGITLSPFFFTLQLLTIVYLEATTNYVVKAITTHFDQLLLTLILSIFVIYCYAVLTAEWFNDTLTPTPDSASNCAHLWDCLMHHVNFGLRNGGGIADQTNAIDPDLQPGRYVAKFFYDIIFFMLINVVALNIIFGIIIDTFSDMRTKKQEKGEKLASQCPVCSISKADIEKSGSSFTSHVHHDHFFWKYNNYICYLTQKNINDFTGFEGKIWSQYIKKSTAWIPESEGPNENVIFQEETVAKLNQLQEKLDQQNVKIDSQVEQIKAVLDTVKETLEQVKATKTAEVVAS